VGDAARTMPRRLVIAVTAAAVLFALPADGRAQTRTVVVPEGAAVVVPPRGSALPRPALKPVAQQRPRLPPMAPAREEGGTGLGGASAVAVVLLPAIAAAAVAAALSNGTGGSGGHTTSGPARTR
jgi:hypothetical protein